jgi:hypothetical protein
MRGVDRAWAGALSLSALLIGGAATLQLIERGRPPSTGGVAWLLGSDWVHVPAHLLLYGALALCCAQALGGRRWLAALAVAGVALAQEASQSLLFGRALGWPEAFDLCVDTLAVAAALGPWAGALARVKREGRGARVLQ